MLPRQEKIIHILIGDTNTFKEIGEFPLIVCSDVKDISKNFMKKLFDDKKTNQDSFSLDVSLMDSERHINENLISYNSSPTINTYEYSSAIKFYYSYEESNSRIILVQTNSLNCSKESATKLMKEIVESKFNNKDIYEQTEKLDSNNQVNKNETKLTAQYTKMLMYLYSKYNRNTDTIFKKDRMQIEKTNSWRKFKIGFIIIIMLIALALVILIPIVMILSKNYNHQTSFSEKFELNNH